MSTPTRQASARRFLLFAGVVIAVVVGVLWFRAEQPKVEFVAQPVARGATALPKAAADESITHDPTAATRSALAVVGEQTPTAPDDSPTASPVPTTTLDFRIVAEFGGGCIIPPETPVEFVQLFPDARARIKNSVPLASLTGASLYTIEWADGASALAVAIRTEEVIMPGAYIERATADALVAGEHTATEFSPETLTLGITVADDESFAVCGILDSSMFQSTPSADPLAAKTITLNLKGTCYGEIIVELPDDVPSSLVEQVEVYSNVPYLALRDPSTDNTRTDIVRLFTHCFPPPRSAIHRKGGEIFIRNLPTAAYALSLRTSDSRSWSVAKIEVKNGESYRLHASFQNEGSFQVGVSGARDLDDEITYQLRGFWDPTPYRQTGVDGVDVVDRSSRIKSITRIAKARDKVTFPGMPKGYYSVSARDDHGASNQVSVTLDAQESREVVIDLKSSVPVTIRVVGDEGKVIEGDGVALTISDEKTLNVISQHKEIPGGIVTENLIPGAYRVLVADSDEKRATSRRIDVVGPGKGDTHTIVFSELQLVRGRVTDARNQPRVGVLLRADTTARDNESSGAVDMTQSDEFGNFELSLPSGHYALYLDWNRIFVLREFDVPLPANDPILRVQIVEATARGVVLDAETRKPIPDTHVFFFQEQVQAAHVVEMNWGTSPGTSRNAISDGNGEFVMERLIPGEYMVSAGTRGYGESIRPVSVTTDSQPPFEMLLTSGRRNIIGHVTDSDGRPISGVVLRSLKRNGQEALFKMNYVHTDADGNYNAFGLQPGEHVLHFDRSEYAADRRLFLPHTSPVISVGADETYMYDFTLENAAEATLIVTDADGAPIRGVRAVRKLEGTALDSEQLLGLNVGTTDRNGTYVWERIRPGTYTFGVRFPDGSELWQEHVTLADFERKTVTFVRE